MTTDNPETPTLRDLFAMDLIDKLKTPQLEAHNDKWHEKILATRKTLGDAIMKGQE